MSRTFYANAIYILTDDAKGIDHDGTEFVNEDFPKNTVLCTDETGDVFVYTQTFADVREVIMPKAWPRRTKHGIPLFRDYWRFAYSSTEHQGAPYYRSIVEAPKTIITAA